MKREQGMDGDGKRERKKGAVGRFQDGANLEISRPPPPAHPPSAWARRATNLRARVCLGARARLQVRVRARTSARARAYKCASARVQVRVRASPATPSHPYTRTAGDARAQLQQSFVPPPQLSKAAMVRPPPRTYFRV